MYKNLLKNPDFYEIKYPQTIVPAPTEDDYSVGFIRRYFIKRANDLNGHIFEVDEKTYAEFVANQSPFWIIESLKWRISGPKSAISNEFGIVTDPGVISANRYTLGLASEKLKNIKLYLPNLTQFHRG